MKTFIHSLIRFKRCESAVALLEFAIFLPLMLTLLIGMAELGRYAIIHQKVSKAAHEVADLVTRNSGLTQVVLTSYADAVDQIMEPIPFTGTVIFNSIASNTIKPAGAATISARGNPGLGVFSLVDGAVTDPRDQVGCIKGCMIWQETRRGSDPSRVATAVGQQAVIQGGYQLNGTQDVIIVEVFFDYTPMLGASSHIIPGIQAGKNYVQVMSKPRQGELITAPQ